MLVMEASSAARASAIWRRVSGEWGRVDGCVDAWGAGPPCVCGLWVEEGWVLVGGSIEGAWVLVEADADADAEPDMMVSVSLFRCR